MNEQFICPALIPTPIQWYPQKPEVKTDFPVLKAQDIKEFFSLRFCSFGFLGSGKTLSVVKEAYRYSKLHPKNKIYSNVVLNKDLIPNFVPLFDIEQLFGINEPCFILRDEWWAVSDSRQFQSPENKADNIILLRSRKKDWVVGTTEQWYTQLDLRQRFVTDVWIFPQFFQSTGVLVEDLYDIHATHICQRSFDGRKFFDLYRTEDDPLTLDINRVRAEYMRKRFRASGVV